MALWGNLCRLFCFSCVDYMYVYMWRYLLNFSTSTYNLWIRCILSFPRHNYIFMMPQSTINCFARLVIWILLYPTVGSFGCARVWWSPWQLMYSRWRLPVCFMFLFGCGCITVQSSCNVKCNKVCNHCVYRRSACQSLTTIVNEMLVWRFTSYYDVIIWRFTACYYVIPLLCQTLCYAWHCRNVSNTMALHCASVNLWHRITEVSRLHCRRVKPLVMCGITVVSNSVWYFRRLKHCAVICVWYYWRHPPLV